MLSERLNDTAAAVRSQAASVTTHIERLHLIGLAETIEAAARIERQKEKHLAFPARYAASKATRHALMLGVA